WLWHLWHPVLAGALTGTRPTSTAFRHSSIGFQSTSQSRFWALHASHLSSPCKTSHCFEGPFSLLEPLLLSAPIASASLSLFSTYGALRGATPCLSSVTGSLPDSLDNYLLPPPFSAAQVAVSAVSPVVGSPPAPGS